MNNDQWLDSLSVANPDPYLVMLLNQGRIADEQKRYYKNLIVWNWIMLGLILVGGGLVLMR